jgi:hypothetical protein
MDEDNVIAMAMNIGVTSSTSTMLADAYAAPSLSLDTAALLIRGDSSSDPDKVGVANGQIAL